MDIGESLVGAYMRQVRRCHTVAFNLQIESFIGLAVVLVSRSTMPTWSVGHGSDMNAERQRGTGRDETVHQVCSPCDAGAPRADARARDIDRVDNALRFCQDHLWAGNVSTLAWMMSRPGDEEVSKDAGGQQRSRAPLRRGVCRQ
jgi:hypothetical protein